MINNTKNQKNWRNSCIHNPQTSILKYEYFRIIFDIQFCRLMHLSLRIDVRDCGYISLFNFFNFLYYISFSAKNQNNWRNLCLLILDCYDALDMFCCRETINLTPFLLQPYTLQPYTIHLKCKVCSFFATKTYPKHQNKSNINRYNCVLYISSIIYIFKWIFFFIDITFKRYFSFFY